MTNFFVLYLALTVFGVGVTIVDFLGLMDQDGSGETDGDSAPASKSSGSYLADTPSKEKPAFRLIAVLMGLLRSTVYFSLGFGPTGLFALFSGLSQTAGLLWAGAVGLAMIALARLLKRFIRRDLDSSIKPDELIHEKGVLLLPLEGSAISKASVHQFGRETRIYVRCADENAKLAKGQEITIVDYDNDIYWIKPAQ